MLENDPEVGGDAALPQEGPFDTFLKETLERQKGGLRISAHLASKIPPAQAAETLSLSVRSGLPLDVVFRDVAGVKAQADQMTDLELEALRTKAPKTAEWASDPYRMAAAKDDLARFAAIEELLGAMAKPTFRPSTDQELEARVGPEARRRAAEDFPRQDLTPVSMGEGAYHIPQKQTLEEMERDYVTAATKAARRREAFLQGDTSRTSFVERMGEAFTTGAEAGVGTNVLGRLGIRRVFGEDNPQLRAAIAETQKKLEITPQGSDFATNFLYPAAKMTAQMVDSADKAVERGAQGAMFGGMLGAFGGPAAPVTVPGGMLGGFGVGMQFGMAEQAFVTEGGNAYVELDQIRGKNGEQLDENVKRGAAIGVGVLNAALEVVGIKLVTAPFKAAARKSISEGIQEVVVKPTMKRALLEFGKDYVGATLGEAGTEVTQEVVNVVAEEIAKMASHGEFESATPGEITERLIAVGSETLRGTAILGGAGAGTNLAATARQVRQAKHTQETLAKIAQLQEQVKLALTNPEESERIGRSVAAQIGMPFVTVAAAPIAEFYQKRGVDPGQRIAQLTGTAEGFAETVQAGGDIQIPTEKYLTMSPEEKTFFQGEIRRDPLDMTVSETEKLLAQEREAAESKAAESLSNDVIVPIARRVAKREATAQLEEMKRSDIISQVRHDFGRLYWLSESGKTNVEELTESGIPRDMIADLRRVDKEGRDYAAPIDEVAAKYDLSPETLLDEVRKAGVAREKAASAIMSDEIPDHIIEAVTDSEFQKAIRSNLAEAEQDRKLSEAVAVRARHKQVVASVQRVTDEIKTALEGAGFRKEAAVMAQYFGSTFQTLGQRENIDPYELFKQRPLVVERSDEAVQTREGQVYEQPAYHGSPHKFDKFSIQKIGTGEGHQAYGWGLYFAGNKAVAAYYRDALSRGSLPSMEVLRQYFKPGNIIPSYGGMDRVVSFNEKGKDGYAWEVAVRHVERQGDQWVDSGPVRVHQTIPSDSNIRKVLGNYEPGRLFTVDIPEDADYLDWDAEYWDEQSGKVRKALQKIDPHYVDVDLEHVYGITGKQIYDILAGDLGSPEAASKALAAEGIAGIKFDDKISRGKQSGTHNYVIFDDKLVDVKSYEQPGDAGKPARGRIRLGDVSIKIEMFKEADASTFLHETGHLYLDVLERLAGRAEASEQIKADWEAVRSWLELKPGEKLSKANHEQWAESFERYLLEGKAPSVNLRGAFYRFKEWLTEIYRGAKEALGIELNDDIRRVMDRLLATDEQILQAQFDQAQAPLFEDAKAAGATDQQAKRYAELTLKARQLAEEKLLQKAMGQARREQEDWYKAERTKVRGEVEKEVNREPLYRAVSVLQRNETPSGAKLITPVLKIDRDSIDSILGGDVDLNTFPRGISSKTGGTHVDVVGGMFGFQDGLTFLDALQGMEDRKARIERVTDERMQAEYGGEFNESELKEIALASIHNDARAEQLLLEMQILARGDKQILRFIAGGIPRMDVVRKDAERAVGLQNIGKLNPRRHAAAERRAAKATLEAHLKGDDAEAVRQKRNEIVNHERFIAEDFAKEDYEAARQRWKVLEKQDEHLAKSRDMDFVNVARAILASVNIGKTEKSASSYLEFIQRYDPQLYADMKALVDEVVPESPRDIEELTYDEFRALKKGVDAMLEMSTKVNEIKVGLNRVHINDVIGGLTEELDNIEPAKRRDATRTKGEEFIGHLVDARAGFTRVEHWAGAIGDYWKRVFPEKIHEGTDAYRVFLDEQLKKYEEIVRGLPKLSSKAINAPELGFTFKNGKRELLGALFHTGNAEDGGGNLWKLLLGRRWATMDEEGNLNTSNWDRFIERMQREGVLTKADYDFVQKVWDLFEDLKPQLQQTHKALNGYYFNEVTATPFQTPWGEYRGGYFPALADPSEVEAAAIRGEQAEAEVGNSFSLPTSGAGRTKKRSASYWRPLRMDVDQVTEHVRWVGKYIHIEPHVAELRRIMWNTGFRDRLHDFNPSAAGGIIMPWLQRTALQTVEKQMPRGWSFAGKAARWLKQVAGVKQIGLNVINGAQNFEGLVVATTKVNPGTLVRAAGSYLASPLESHEAIAELSPYMKHRTQEVVGSLQDATQEILHDAGLWKDAQRLTMKHVFVLSKLTQGIVDDIVWKAAFNDALAQGHGQDEAVRAADSIVRTTQGSSAPEDISAFEAGNAVARLFTMYTSWFNMRANLLGAEGVKIMRQEVGLPARAQRIAYLYTAGFAVPSLVAGMIYKVMSGQKLDPDDDGYLDDLVRFFFGSQAKELAGMAPVVGPTLELMVNAFDKNPMNDTLTVSPVISLVQQLGSTAAHVYKATMEEDRYGRPIKGAKGKAVEDVLTAFGALTGMPLGAIAKQAKYVTNVAEGARKPSSAYDFIRGAVTGTGSRNRD